MLQMRMCSNQMKQTKVLARFLPLPAVSASFSYRNVNFPPQLYGIRYKSYKMEQPVFWPTHSNYDVDAGHLFKLLGWKNLACQKQFQRVTMVYRSLHAGVGSKLSQF